MRQHKLSSKQISVKASWGPRSRNILFERITDMVVSEQEHRVNPPATTCDTGELAHQPHNTRGDPYQKGWGVVVR
jgi:hypothetical protein